MKEEKNVSRLHVKFTLGSFHHVNVRILRLEEGMGEKGGMGIAEERQWKI